MTATYTDYKGQEYQHHSNVRGEKQHREAQQALSLKGLDSIAIEKPQGWWGIYTRRYGS